MPTLWFRHIQDPGISGSNIVKQHLLLNSSSSFKSLFRSIWKIFSHLCFKSKHSTFFSSGTYFNNSNSNNNSVPPTLTRHPRYTRWHATHASRTPTPQTLARHQRKHSIHGTHASTNSMPFLKLIATRFTLASVFILLQSSLLKSVCDKIVNT